MGPRKRSLLGLLTVLSAWSLLWLSGCNDNGSPDDAGMGDATSDTGLIDGGSDADGDGDADSDTDTDADTDADADADSGEDAGDAGEDAECPYDANDRVGWVRTWGGPDSEQGTAVAAGPDGAIIVAGYFQGTTDFDPGSGKQIETSSGYISAYLSKFMPDGEYVWSRFIKGSWWVDALGVAILSDGSIVMGGTYSRVADFDPGSGEEEQDAGQSGEDTYVLHLTSEGEFDWVSTLRGEGYIVFYDMSVSIDNHIFTTGTFTDNIILEQDGGITQELTCKGDKDVYVAKIGPDGQGEWIRSVGGGSGDQAGAVSVGQDGSVLFIGQFEGAMDFDPGPGVDEYTGDIWDVFLIKLDTDGNYVWGKHIQGAGIEFGRAVAVDTDGNVYAGVEHSNPVDFDPDSSGNEAACDNNYCFTIAKYSADGIFDWASTIAGSGVLHNIKDLNVTSDGPVVVGYFEGSVDFDPGPGEEMRSVPDGEWRWDTFLLELGITGEYQWVTNIGAPGACAGLSVASDSEEYLYLTGYFVGTMDFDPSECSEMFTCGEDGDAFLLRLDDQGKFYSNEGRILP